MKFEETLEQLKEVNPEMYEIINAKISKDKEVINGLNAENKNRKLQNRETNEIMSHLLEKLDVKDVNEAYNVKETSSKEIEALSKRLKDFEDRYAKIEKEKESALMESAIQEKLSKFKIDDPFMKKSLMNMVVKGESGELLLDNVLLDDFLQERSDKSKTTFKIETKTVGKEDLFSLDELEKLTPEQYAANKDKVERSIAALG